MPTQNTSDSSIEPFKVICWLVLAATTPVSTDVVQAVSEYKLTRAYKVWFAVLGLVTAPNTICRAEPVVVLAAPVAVARKLPAVPLLTLQVPDKLVELNVDEVVTRPPGVEHAPDAFVHICA